MRILLAQLYQVLAILCSLPVSVFQPQSVLDIQLAPSLDEDIPLALFKKKILHFCSISTPHFQDTNYQ